LDISPTIMAVWSAKFVALQSRGATFDSCHS
jgi:hypothetical protein